MDAILATGRLTTGVAERQEERGRRREQVQWCFVRQRYPASYHGHVHGVSVRITIHSHRSDAHLLGRAHHAARDLSAIGNQHLLYPSHPWRRHSRHF